VKDLVNGSGIVFHDRGTHVLKGVPGQWQLFAPVGERDLREDLRTDDQEPIPDQLVDRLTGRPRLTRTLLRMARKR
jgi:hypothetical protein